MGIGIGIELRRRDSRNADLMNEEPAKLEIARTAGNMGRERIVLWEFDRGHIGENEVPAFGVRVLTHKLVRESPSKIRIPYRDVKFIKDSAEPFHLLLHFGATLVPESSLVGLLECHCGGLLQRRHTAVAYPGMRASYVFDQVLRSNEVPDAPAGGVEGFASRADGKSAFVELWRHGPDSGEWDVEQAVVDFVGEYDKVVLHAEVPDTLQLVSGEDLPDRVVAVSDISGELGT